MNESEPRLDRSDLELLLAIRRHGTLAAAAASADVVPSVVTKRLAALESRLGLKLFHRTTRRVAATPEGEALCDRAEELLRWLGLSLEERKKILLAIREKQEQKLLQDRSEVVEAEFTVKGEG